MQNAAIENSLIYSVSQLNSLARQLLTTAFDNILVTGEISNLSSPASGHLYFTLKDAKAQIRCALFRNRNTPNFNLVNGLQVTVRAQVSLYEPRGDYQLIVNAIESEGTGDLKRDFELLKTRLAAEGLFNSEHKQPLPLLPRAIGVITSPTGAAIRDILSVLQRRFPAIPVIIYPTSVQGQTAKSAIVAAIHSANERQECDVIILARGGGSLEDLWAFNEEIVARAIFHSNIPIITGIGHEIDFTIADFVADLRAATPSAAAEHAVPEQREWLQRWKQLDNLLIQRFQSKRQQYQQRADWLDKRLQQQHPQQQLLRNAQTLDHLELRLQNALQTRLQRLQAKINQQQAKLWQHSPSAKISRYQQQQHFLWQRAQQAIKQTLARDHQKLAAQAQTLQALSPLATLERGYAIVQRTPNDEVITNSQTLKIGDLLQTRFAQGRMISQVQEIYP